MAKYILTEKAKEDLNSIWDYTFDAWSEHQADRYYDILIEAFKKLSLRQTLGKHYEEVTTDILGYHVGKHLIFYRITSSTEIKIVRILHERMDISQHDLE